MIAERLIDKINNSMNKDGKNDCLSDPSMTALNVTRVSEKLANLKDKEQSIGVQSID